MHAIIDNFSRRILAWTVRASFDTSVTALLLREAAKGLSDTKPSAVTDSGVENINASMNELIESGIIKRVLAQVDVTYSNSMIESWSAFLLLSGINRLNEFEKRRSNLSVR